MQVTECSVIHKKGYCIGCDALRFPSSSANAVGDTSDSMGCVWSVTPRCLSPSWSTKPQPAAAGPHHDYNYTGRKKKKHRKVLAPELHKEYKETTLILVSIFTSWFCPLFCCFELCLCCSFPSPAATGTASCCSISASCSWVLGSPPKGLCFPSPQIHYGEGRRWGTGFLPRLLRN